MASNLYFWQLFVIQIGTALVSGYVAFRMTTLRKALFFAVVASFVASISFGFVFGFGNGFIAAMRGQG